MLVVVEGLLTEQMLLAVRAELVVAVKVKQARLQMELLELQTVAVAVVVEVIHPNPRLLVALVLSSSVTLAPKKAQAAQ
jgi:hypothetical protein